MHAVVFLSDLVDRDRASDAAAVLPRRTLRRDERDVVARLRDGAAGRADQRSAVVQTRGQEIQRIGTYATRVAAVAPLHRPVLAVVPTGLRRRRVALAERDRD